MEHNINELILVDSETSNTSYGGFVIAKDDVWDVLFCYAKQDLLEIISIYSEQLSSGLFNSYEQQIRKSNLPDWSPREVIAIDGSAGLLLAEALYTYQTAQRVPFRPHAGWPMTNDIPKSGLVALYSSNTIEDLDCELAINLYNILFAISVGSRNIMYVANSQEQCAEVLEEISTLPLRKKGPLIDIIGNPMLPEHSTDPLIRVVGECADHVCPAVFYYNSMKRKVQSFGDCPWKEKFQ